MLRCFAISVCSTSVAIAVAALPGRAAGAQSLPQAVADSLVRRDPTWARRRPPLTLEHVFSAVQRPDGQTAIAELQYRRPGASSGQPGLALFRRTPDGWRVVVIETDRRRFERVYGMR